MEAPLATISAISVSSAGPRTDTISSRVIGMIDSFRASQLTEQLLHSIRDTRAKVVVVDITGVPYVDSRVASHLVQTVEAARLMGSKVIVSGVSPEIALTMVTLGIDLGRIETVGDMQSGLELAEKISGYKMVRVDPDRDLDFRNE